MDWTDAADVHGSILLDPSHLNLCSISDGQDRIRDRTDATDSGRIDLF